MTNIAQRIAEIAESDVISAKWDEHTQVRSVEASDSLDVRPYLAQPWYRVSTDRTNADELFLALLGEGDFQTFSRHYDVVDENTLCGEDGTVLSITALEIGQEIPEQH